MMDGTFKTHDWAQDFWMIEPVGSRVTCNPAPQDTDEDYLVFDHAGVVIAHLESQGFDSEGKPEFYTGNDAG